MDEFCRTQRLILEELDQRSALAPFLALGQTVFWDEPMKAGVLQSMRQHGFSRRFVAGVHDTDYFAKTPVSLGGKRFAALRHNDTSTRSLWSAAAEFSSLFGSETVVTRSLMARHGAKVQLFEHEEPGFIDDMTEAWGWRGVACADASPPTSAELPFADSAEALCAALDQAVAESAHSILSLEARRVGGKVHQMLCEAGARPNSSLGDAYREIVADAYALASGEAVDVEASATTELLQFNSQTAGLPRFRILDAFLNPATRRTAEAAYNAAVEGSETYPLPSFGTGALPFEVWLPGRGRGTLRLGSRGGVIDFREPVGFSLRRRPESAQELAEALEAKFGPQTVLIGKAVTLIGMLAAEFIFVMHEGASGYIHRSRRMHQTLAESGFSLDLNPILRIGYDTWGALEHASPVRFRLPEPLQVIARRAEADSQELAQRLPDWQAEAQSILDALAEIRRPDELLAWLAQRFGGEWSGHMAELESARQTIDGLRVEMDRFHRQRRALVDNIRILKRMRNCAEHELGRHFRAHVFEQAEPDLAGREALQARIEDLRRQTSEGWAEWRKVAAEQEAALARPDFQNARQVRLSLARRAERERIRLIRACVFTRDGMAAASRRPAAWWLPMATPDGSWFRAAASRAKWRLEELA
jgi:predicted phage tail protein